MRVACHHAEMDNLTLTLPAESLVGVRIPPQELHNELRRRLAVALYADGILSGASACRMEAMGKAEFQYLLGERGIAQPLNERDYAAAMAPDCGLRMMTSRAGSFSSRWPRRRHPSFSLSIHELCRRCIQCFLLLWS